MEFVENVLNQYFGGENVIINLLEEETLLSEEMYHAEMVQHRQDGFATLVGNELSEA